MDLTPTEIADTGKVFVALGYVHLRARESGIDFDHRLGNVYWIERGLVVRQREFTDWEEALRAAGIQAEAVPTPVR